MQLVGLDDIANLPGNWNIILESSTPGLDWILALSDRRWRRSVDFPRHQKFFSPLEFFEFLNNLSNIFFFFLIIV